MAVNNSRHENTNVAIAVVYPGRLLLFLERETEPFMEEKFDVNTFYHALRVIARRVAPLEWQRCSSPPCPLSQFPVAASEQHE